MVALASVYQKLQQAMVDGPGQKLTTDMVLTNNELDWAASTKLEHASGKMFIQKPVREAGREEVNKSWASSNKLVGLFNKDCLIWLGTLFNGGIQSTFSMY